MSVTFRLYINVISTRRYLKNSMIQNRVMFLLFYVHMSQRFRYFLYEWEAFELSLQRTLPPVHQVIQYSLWKRHHHFVRGLRPNMFWSRENVMCLCEMPYFQNLYSSEMKKTHLKNASNLKVIRLKSETTMKIRWRYNFSEFTCYVFIIEQMKFYL